jgi:hypothetical protein
VEEGRDGHGTGQPHRVARRILTNVQNDAENARQIIRYGEVQSSKWRRKVARGASPEKKMLINDERSQYIYENKQNDDNLPTAKGEKFA